MANESAQKLSCPACASGKSSLVGSKNRYTLRKCVKCGTIFSDLQIEKETDAREVKEMYDNYYNSSNFEILPATEKSLQKAVESFVPFKQTGRFLDIGFGEGAMLTVAQKNGWNCYGTEISPHSLEYGAAKNWTVSADALNDANFPPDGFDVVTMIELIEHVPNPDDFLQLASRMLRDGGLLYVTTPNAGSINQHLLGIKWSVISPPEHINIWSLKGFKQALSRAGFHLQERKTEGFNPVEIISKLKSSKAEIGGHERSQAALALNDAFTGSGPRLMAKTMINRGLNLFGVGDTLKIRAICRK